MRIITTSSRVLYMSICCFIASICCLQAQTIGDFRSMNSGNWTNISIWQTYNGSSWIAATAPPSVSAPNITVQHAVVITDSVTISGTSTLLITSNGMLDFYKTVTNRGTINNDGIINWFTGDIITRDSLVSGRINNRLSGAMNVQPYTPISMVNQKLTNAGILFKFGNLIWNINEMKLGNGSFDSNASGVMIFYGSLINLNTSSNYNGSLENYGTLTLGNTNGMIFKGNQLRNNGFINNNFVKFEGTTQQKITGTGTFQRLSVNNPAGILAQNGLNISSEIRLIWGKINLSGNQLTVGTSPTNEGILFGGNDTSYVYNGSIRRWVNASQLQLQQFPIGTATSFLQATITLDSINAAGSLTVQYLTTDPLEWGLPLVDADGYLINSTCETCGIWDIKASDGLSVKTYRLALLLNNYPGINNPTNLRIIHRPIPSVPWVLRGKHNSGSGISGRFTARRDSLNVFGEFAIGGGLDNSLLPVELTTFNAYRKGNSSAIVWETASERNVNFFQIERSTDARTFINIGQVKAFGNTTEAHKYLFMDDKPYAGINYYRLKIMDADEKFEYSRTVSVQYDKKIKAWVYPNPVSEKLILERDTEGVGSFDLEITDAVGRVYFNAKNIDNQQYSLNFSNFTNGLYFVKMINGKDISVFKVIKN